MKQRFAKVDIAGGASFNLPLGSQELDSWCQKQAATGGFYDAKTETWYPVHRVTQVTLAEESVFQSLSHEELELLQARMQKGRERASIE